MNEQANKQESSFDFMNYNSNAVIVIVRFHFRKLHGKWEGDMGLETTIKSVCG